MDEYSTRCNKKIKPHQFARKGRLPHIEVRALASIGAGLLKKHRGNAQEINKLLAMAVAIDRHDYDQTVKTLTDLCNEAIAPEPIYDDFGGHAMLAASLKK